MRQIPLFMQMHRAWRDGAVDPADWCFSRSPGESEAWWDMATVGLMGGEL